MKDLLFKLTLIKSGSKIRKVIGALQPQGGARVLADAAAKRIGGQTSTARALNPKKLPPKQIIKKPLPQKNWASPNPELGKTRLPEIKLAPFSNEKEKLLHLMGEPGVRSLMTNAVK